jgi:hypothetical protein
MSVYNVIYEAESALCNINEHHLELYVLWNASDERSKYNMITSYLVHRALFTCTDKNVSSLCKKGLREVGREDTDIGVLPVLKCPATHRKDGDKN